MSPLPEIEWDFSNIPNEQIWVCHDWEFGRTKILMDNPCFQSNPDHWETDMMFSFDAPYGHFGPPWPHSPFASLTPDLREDMGARLNTSQGLFPFSIQAVRNTDEPLSSHASTMNIQGPSGAEAYIAAFQIDRRFSKKAIVDAFAAWLDEVNEIDPPEGERIEMRGRQAPTAFKKENLEALGILRIIQHHKKPISQIISLYAGKLARRFTEEAAWSRAKKRAEEVLEEVLKR